jgi:HemY protein
MRAVIQFLIVAAVVIGLAWWLAGLTGTVSATFGGTTIATSAPIAVLAAAVLFLVLYVIVRLLVGLIRLPRRTARLRAARARQRGETALTRTLLALAGGDGETAMREAQRSRRLLGDTPQTLLLAAYAGRQVGDQEEAARVFQILADREDASFLGLRGLLQQAVARGDWTEATRLSRRAEAANPGAPWLRTERKQLAIRAGAWRDALNLADPGDPVAAFGAAAANAEADPAEARRLAKRAWEADQGFAPAALAYAARLREAGKESRAQVVLRTAWTKSPHPELADAMLTTASDDVTRTRRAEALAAAVPNHLESQLLLGRVALAAGLLGEAQRHAEAARAAGCKQRRLWLLLADIAERSGNQGAQSEALLHAANADPDPGWRCGSCGAVQAAWTPTCERCGISGQLGWGTVATRPRLLADDGGETILP